MIGRTSKIGKSFEPLIELELASSSSVCKYTEVCFYSFTQNPVEGG